MVEIVPADLHGAKNSVDLLGAMRMTFFPRAAGVLRQISGTVVQQILQQVASVFEQGLPQSQFDCLQIANARLFPLLADQPQEGSGFSKLFLCDLRGLEFFLASGWSFSHRVIWSVILTNCSASSWKR